MLDTNAVIAIIGQNRNVIKNLMKHSPDDFCISSIAMHELYYGVYKSQRIADNLARVDNLKFEVVALSKSDGLASGLIRASLKLKGTPIGPYDVLIAGQAISRSLTLITNNVKEFKRVENLVWEDWQ